MPAASRVATPGTIVSASCGARTTRSASAVSDAGQSTYGASTQPCRLPIIPHAMRGAGSSIQSPSSFASAGSKRPSRTCLMPSGTLRCVQHVAVGIEAIGARGRGSPVDCDERRGGHWEAGDRLPALRGFVVARARLDPALAVGHPFLFPERRARLQPDPSRTRTHRTPSPRCALVTTTSTIWSPGASAPTRWMTSASRMSNRAPRLGDDLLERRLRHARIVLERQAGDRRSRR